MLDSMRDAAGGFVAKVLMGLLVLSFAVWGFSDQFFGYGTGTLAEVGETQVSALDFNRALQRRTQELSRQINRPVTLEQARELGLPQQVLAELVSQAALDEQARKYNLGVSDDTVATVIASDPSFHGQDGKFDRVRFEAILRNIGMTDDDFIKDLRGQIIRRQLASSIVGEIAAPKAMVRAYYEYQNESRAVSFIALTADMIDPLGEPDAADLQAYFDQNKARYRAPEYRSIGFLVLSPSVVADEAAITAQDIADEYEAQLPKFTTSERRAVRQIRFETEEEARAALSVLGETRNFESLRLSRDLAAEDTDLGLKSRAEIIDTKIADAAFSAEQGALVEVYDADFGPVIIEVATIEPATVRTLEEVSDQLRRELAQTRGLDEINDLYDAIEDERAGGATLAEAANKLDLRYQTTPGLALDGSVIEDATAPVIPGRGAVINDAFASDVGVENNPLRTQDDTWVFYEVLEITPDRDRTIDEIRSTVAKDWRNEQLATALGVKAEALLNRLKSGATLETLAAELVTPVTSVENVTRSGGEISANGRALAFAGPQGHVANAEADNAPDRILLRVDRVSAPAFFTESQDARSLDTQVRQNLQADIIQAYTSQLLQENNPFVNNAVFAALIGQTNDGL